jgi:cob(I)alamin adenosyltransferase
VEKGLIHIYCGDGKGKTTAAFGLVLRAVGQNKKILVCQLLKDGKSGEILALRGMRQVEIIEGFNYTGFVNPKNEKDLKEVKGQQQKKLCLVMDKMERGAYDLVVIDELCTALSLGVIDEKLAEALIEKKPFYTELVFTGRSPTLKLMESADYISEISCIKHPYQKGVPARKGIEW